MEEYIFSNASYLPLYTHGAIPFHGRVFGGISINDNLPLYTSGNYGAAESLMLFVSGQGFLCSSSLDLICYNNSIVGSLSLYTVGEGVNDGYLPVNNSLMLFIKCAFGATLPMYTYGGPQPSLNDSLDLYTLGGQSLTASLNLVIPNVIGYINSTTLKLYTHGY